MVNESLVDELLAALSLPRRLPGAEGEAWRLFSLELRDVLRVVMAGEGKLPEPLLVSLLESHYFLRLPTFPSTAVDAYLLMSCGLELPEDIDAKWLRRYVGDFAGLAGLLRDVEDIRILAKMNRYYPETIMSWPEEHLDERVPCYVREDLPEAPFRDLKTELADLVVEQSPFLPSPFLFSLLPKARRIQERLPSDPKLLRSALLEFLHFQGLPRLPKSWRTQMPREPWDPLRVSLVLGLL